jgi:hypothetical protein
MTVHNTLSHHLTTHFHECRPAPGNKWDDIVSHFVCPAAQGRSWGLDLHEESWELLGCPMGAACRSKQACACVGMILSKVNDVEICLLAHHGVVTLTEVDAAMQMSHCVRLHFRFPSEEVDPPPEPRLPHNTATDWARTLYPLESPPIPYDCDSRKKLLDSNQNVVQSLCFTKHDVSIVNDSPKIGGIAKGAFCAGIMKSGRHVIQSHNILSFTKQDAPIGRGSSPPPPHLPQPCFNVSCYCSFKIERCYELSTCEKRNGNLHVCRI